MAQKTYVHMCANGSIPLFMVVVDGCDLFSSLVFSSASSVTASAAPVPLAPAWLSSYSVNMRFVALIQRREPINATDCQTGHKYVSLQNMTSDVKCFQRDRVDGGDISAQK